MDRLAAAAGFLAAVYLGVRLLTGVVLAHLHRRAILDHPNERSSHAVPTPRGGGLAVVAVLLPAWLVAAAFVPGEMAATGPLVVLAAGLAGLSWLDDLRGLPAGLRLLAQALAVAAALALLPARGPFFAGLLPPALDLAAAGLLWVWFVNLFNFMDGIDGITGAETAALGLGVAAVASAGGLTGAPVLYGLSTAAAALGFLAWNWHPARVFLGDVGSVPLGFLLGGLLLDLAARGQWAPALILPLYYLADATITLARRAARGEKVWQAHRQHFYQRAVQGGLDHAAVVRAVALADGGLIVLAVLALRWPGPALAAACAVVFGLLSFLGKRRPGR